MSVFTVLNKIIFTLSATGAWLASAGFNALTGAQMGHDQTTTALWVTAALSMDLLKAGAAIKINTASGSTKAIAAMLLTTATIVSLIAALTMRSAAQADASAHRQHLTETKKGFQDEIRTAQTERNSLQVTRFAATIKAELKAKHANRLWTRTSSCADATLPTSVKFCNRVDQLTVELKAANRKTVLAEIISTARAQLDALPTTTATTATPVAISLQAYLAAMGINRSAAQIDQLLILFLTIALEFGAVAGPMLAATKTTAAKCPKNARSKPAPKPAQPKTVRELVEQRGDAGQLKITLRDAAKILNVKSPATISRWIKSEGLTSANGLICI